MRCQELVCFPGSGVPTHLHRSNDGLLATAPRDLFLVRTRALSLEDASTEGALRCIQSFPQRHRVAPVLRHPNHKHSSRLALAESCCLYYSGNMMYYQPFSFVLLMDHAVLPVICVRIIDDTYCITSH